MPYFSYYLLWSFFAYALREPWLLVGVAVFLLLRRVIPDPTAIFRALSRRGALRTQVEVNPSNVIALRDLAQIQLDLLRPRSALALVEQALVRTPDEPELLYLQGLALHRGGRHEDALAPLVRAVELDPRVRFGEPYRVAGAALYALGKYDAAVDAYERYLEANTSDVATFVSLARAQARLGDGVAAGKAIDEAFATWRVLPKRMRRRDFFKGYVAAQWARVSVLKEPAAIAVAVGLTAALGAAAGVTYPLVANAFARESSSPHAFGGGVGVREARLRAALPRCGTQSTGSFVGRYATVSTEAAARPAAMTAPLPSAQSVTENDRAERPVTIDIRRDRIIGGGSMALEFCLASVIESTPVLLHAEAVLHTVDEGPTAELVQIWLRREGDIVRFTVAEFGGGETLFARLKRE